MAKPPSWARHRPWESLGVRETPFCQVAFWLSNVGKRFEHFLNIFRSIEHLLLILPRSYGNDSEAKEKWMLKCNGVHN